MRLPGPANRATDLLGCELPIVLAGMGGVARAELVAAVTAAGGFGFLGRVREPVALIIKEVAALRRMGYGNFGVNIIPAATDRALLERQLEALVELHVPAVALFWDIDAGVVARFRDAGITVVYQVGSVDEAIAAERAGAQMIIAQGVEAGGHVRGTRPLYELLPATVAAVGVPVLAAGGLATGGDLLTARALGAEGIVLGTALMATDEAFAHDDHKRRLLAASAGDTVLTDTFHINWPPGAPVRVLKSEVTAGRRGVAQTNERIVIGEEEGRPIYLFSTDSPLRSMTGDFGAMALYAGTGVGRLHEVVPAGTRIDEIVVEAGRLLAATQVADMPSSASAVCYAGEMSGAYLGTLDRDEVAVALREIAGGLLHVLRSGLAEKKAAQLDAPPFAADGYELAAWLLTLRELAGAGEPASAPADLATLTRRLGDLVPRMPEGATREAMSALRRVLDERSASQVIRTLQLSLTS
jgi:nitronate monooxygenase